MTVVVRRAIEIRRNVLDTLDKLSVVSFTQIDIVCERVKTCILCLTRINDQVTIRDLSEVELPKDFSISFVIIVNQ